MTIALETTPVTPNAVYTPQILLQTAISGGKLVTSAQIHMAGAKVDDGAWEASGPNGMVYIPDVENLDEDLSGLADDATALYASIVDLVGKINAVRKVL